MRIVATTILVLIILSSAFLDGLDYLAFKLNQQYISVNLCVNINKPEVMCYGSCYLNKQLAKNKEQEKNFPFLQGASKQANLLYYQITTFILVNNYCREKSQIHIGDDFIPDFDYNARLLRPPQC